MPGKYAAMRPMRGRQSILSLKLELGMNLRGSEKGNATLIVARRSMISGFRPCKMMGAKERYKGKWGKNGQPCDSHLECGAGF